MVEEQVIREAGRQASAVAFKVQAGPHARALPPSAPVAHCTFWKPVAFVQVSGSLSLLGAHGGAPTPNGGPPEPLGGRWPEVEVPPAGRFLASCVVMKVGAACHCLSSDCHVTMHSVKASV